MTETRCISALFIVENYWIPPTFAGLRAGVYPVYAGRGMTPFIYFVAGVIIVGRIP